MTEKLIGGELRIDPGVLHGREFNKIEARYSLGRTCLYAILRAIRSDETTVLLPDYLCHSVAEVPRRLDMPVRHYHISTTFSPDEESIRSQLEQTAGKACIILISYFGITDPDDTVRFIRKSYPDVTIIVDDVQNAFGFGNHTDYDYCFSSYRKWFSVPDGADILRREGTKPPDRFDSLPVYAVYKAAGNLLKNHADIIGDHVSLELIRQGEEMMDREYRYRCSDTGRALLHRIDTDRVRETRKKNAKVLHDGLTARGIRHLYHPDRTPLFIPITVQNRDRIRKGMHDQHIFVPVHWPVEDVRAQGENELYSTELSLICDQRYDENDMERILRAIDHEV